MTFRPGTTSRKAVLLAAFCAVFAVISFYVSSCVAQARIVYQVAALAAAIVALEVYLKYVGSDYLYTADDKDLKIYKITGKKSICVCSLNYEESASAVVSSAYVSAHSEKFPKHQIALNYCKNLFPQEYSLYFFNFNGKPARLKFEPDKAFTDYLNQKIYAARSRVEKEENREE
ncbi:MAG: hypothetical protein ACI4RV_03675 [Eubacteriales bacterium]